MTFDKKKMNPGEQNFYTTDFDRDAIDVSKYLVTGKQAAIKADAIIQEEMSGEQIGLKTRWSAVNKAMLKYFRFKQTTIIGGMSGSGKSYILNMLRNDFLDCQDLEFGSIDDLIYVGDEKYSLSIGDDQVFRDSRLGIKPDGTVYRKALNANAKYKPVIIHIGPEMPPEDEYIRSASNIMGCSYAYLLSADHTKGKYNRLTEQEHKTFRRIMNILQENRPEYHYTVPPTVDGLIHLVEKVCNNHPDRKPVVSIDHSLLMRRPAGQSEGESIYRLALACIYIRETFDAIVIPLHQLNGYIESTERKQSVDGHYPVKTDLYFGGQIWWAADNVFIGHQPHKLGIERYGHGGLSTENLYHFPCLKSRRGVPGNIWMKQDLAHGRVFEVERNEFIES